MHTPTPLNTEIELVFSSGVILALVFEIVMLIKLGYADHDRKDKGEHEVKEEWEEVPREINEGFQEAPP